MTQIIPNEVIEAQAARVAVPDWTEKEVAIRPTAEEWQWIVDNSGLIVYKLWRQWRYRFAVGGSTRADRKIEALDMAASLAPSIVRMLRSHRPDKGMSKASLVSSYIWQQFITRFLPHTRFFYSPSSKKNSTDMPQPELLGDRDVIRVNNNGARDELSCDAVRRYVAELRPKWRGYVERYFGIGCEPQTMRAIAASVGRSHQYVQQTVQRAIDELRDRLKSVGLAEEQGSRVKVRPLRAKPLVAKTAKQLYLIYYKRRGRLPSIWSEIVAVVTSHPGLRVRAITDAVLVNRPELYRQSVSVGVSQLCRRGVLVRTGRSYSISPDFQGGNRVSDTLGEG